MDRVDGSDHYETVSQEQSPSLLTIILDTNPAAWSLLSDLLPLSSAVASLLVFINAHLACNYTNKVAVIASHCDKAQWLYPTPNEQPAPRPTRSKRQSEHDETHHNDQLSEPTKRLKLNAPKQDRTGERPPSSLPRSSGNKYRPFRLVEEEVLTNLTTLLTSALPSSLETSTSTMIAGALTLALSYINRETITYAESLTGTTTLSDPTTNTTSNSTDQASSTSLQSRILLISASPSTDLAHQYIPIMNAIFACQRLSIPIDILQLPLPSPPTTSNPESKFTAPSTPSSEPSANSTVFLQQAADATHGIFIPALIPSPTPQTPTGPSSAFLTYLLTPFLPPSSTRTHLILPTRIDVDFRAACFCHRRVIDIGFVCSICLSIFCDVPENGDCLTCGTHLTVMKGVGGKPVVVPRRKKRRAGGSGGGMT